MKKAFALLGISSLLALGGYGQAAFLEQGVIEALDRSAPGELIPIIILLADAEDPELLKADFIARGVPVKERPKQLMRKLKTKAEATQPAVLSIIRESGKAYKNIRALWIGNIISLEAEADLVRLLAELPAIERIGYNIPMYGLDKPQFEGHSLQKSVGGREPGHTAIGAPEMWALGYTGAGTIALTFDTGVWPDHPAHSNRFLPNLMPLQATWFGFDSPLPIDKSSSHGTHVSGTILGLDPATADTIGVAFGAYFIATDPIVSNLADIKPISDLLLGYQWAINPDGNEDTSGDVPDVINNSWGRDNTNPDWEPCPEFAIPVFNAVLAAGIANVFSAGNQGPDPMTIGTPHNINTGLVNSFTIAAVSSTGSFPVAEFSSRGPSICGGEGSLLIKPEVAAPGVNVRSSVANGAYDFFSGTSMAAPHTSGAILLLKEAYPELSGEELQLALYYSATDLGIPGEDNTYGNGMINVMAAYDYLSQEYFPTAPVSGDRDISIQSILSPQIEIGCGDANGLEISPVVEIRNVNSMPLGNFTIHTEVNGEILASYVYPGALLSGESATVTLDPVTILATGLIELHIWIPEIDMEYDSYNNHRTIRWTQLPRLDLTGQNFYNEDFSAGIPSDAWTIQNPDGAATWDTLSVIQVDGAIGVAAWMNHPDYNPIQNQRDYLISPVFTLGSTETYNLSFDYFYRKRSNNTFIHDTLALFKNVMCEDGGLEAQEIWRAGGEELYTNDQNQQDALPESPDDWATVQTFFNLAEADETVYFSLSSINRRGNNLLIDNINLSGVTAVKEFLNGSFKLYPNPAQHELTVQTQTFDMKNLRIFDIAGRIVLERNAKTNNLRIDLPEMAAGTYVVEVNFENGYRKAERLVIQ